MTKVPAIGADRDVVHARAGADTGDVLHPCDPRPRRAPRRRLVLAATAVGLLAAAGCGGDDDAGGTTVVDVALGPMVFEPSVVTVPAGEVELRVTNTDSVVHDLVAASKGTRPLRPGESQALPMGELAPGEYRMWCDQPGHEAMVGTLVVTAAPATAG